MKSEERLGLTMEKQSKDKIFRMTCEKNRRNIIIYAAVSVIFTVLALIFKVYWVTALCGGAAMMLFLSFKVTVSEKLSVPGRFLMLAVCTAVSFMLMQITISCGFFLVGPIKFIFNIVLLLGLSSLFWMVSGSIKLSVTVVTVFCTLVAVIDHIVVQARSFEIQFSDLSSIGVAAEVAGGYSFDLSPVSKGGLIASICFLVLILKSSFPGHQRSFVRTAISMASITATVLCAIFIYSQVGASVVGYQDKYWKFQGSNNNGFFVNMIYSASATRVTVPENYSVNTLKDSTDEYTGAVPAAADGKKAGKKPNVIVVMNETFSDVHHIAEYMGGEMKCSIEPTPFIDSLKNSENVIKGHALASVYGGNTANSEFEFLTETSIQFIPRNTVAYNLYLKEDNVFSVVDLFNKAGYLTVGMHPENKTNWQRDRIYSLYGFDKTYFMDSFDGLTKDDLYRNHISDAAAYRKVEEIYEEKEEGTPMFTFLVTMQNHGGYLGAGLDSDDYVVNIEGYENYMSIREYMACIHNSDGAFRELIEYFEAADEDTVIIFFGDHQPSLTNIASKFYLVNDDDPQEKQMSKYIVPYVIWANYPIECERATELTSINFLSSWMLDMADVGETEYTRFVKAANSDIMAINAMGWFDRDMKFRESDYSVPHYSETVGLWANLQYNMMFDDDRKLPELFK